MNLRAHLVAACLVLSPAAHADRLFADGFQIPVPPSQFPIENGERRIPSGPAADQLAWILGELASGETTTTAEVSAHFVAAYDPATMASFINSLRGPFANAIVTDVVTVTPLALAVVIASPGAPPPYGFVQLQAHYTGSQLVTSFGVSNFSGSVMYPADQALTLNQAVTRFQTLASDSSVLVGRINRLTGTCTAVAQADAGTLRATGSIFKTWVLGGLTDQVAKGEIDLDENVVLDSNFLALGALLDGEPLGTALPLSDMTALMIGISDNAATDHIHHLVGRPAIDAFIDHSGVADANVLKPLLGISEQFHLFFSFPLATSTSYVNGSESFQQQFIGNQIDPLGPYLGGGAYNNESLFTLGSWRASPFDICNAFSRLRRAPQGSDALWLIDHALGASAAQPDVRDHWNRVWYKGGSLESGSNGLLVLTHAWMLENTNEDPWVVIAMANANAGGIDEYAVQSVTGRLLQIVAGM